MAIAVFAVMFVTGMATMVLANEGITGIFKAQIATAPTMLEGKACVTEVSALGNDRYNISVVIGRGCSSPTNTTTRFGRMSDGSLVVAIPTKIGATVYMVEERGSNPQVQQTIQTLQTINTNQQIMMDQQAIIACEQRVAAYNSQQIARAENKGNRCVMQGTAIVDIVQLALMKERDTGGSGITAKDLGEQRLLDFGVNYYCSEKAVARLADPMTCQTDPSYMPGTPAK